MGDIMIRSTENLSNLPNYLVCADGDSNEITEAQSATYINTKSAAHFDEYLINNNGA